MMVVEMVLSEIRKTCCVKSDPGQPLLIECVARSLHGKVRDAMHALQFSEDRYEESSHHTL